jgi:GUN4-like/Caspase domain
MARKALLIGTETYRDGFKPLKSAPHDIEALAGLLRNSDVGGFEPENVQVLLDRESADLATQIETWYLQHSKDDFALLFIAGHGVKDADRKLHFAATNTQKAGESLITTTAIPASNLSNWMQKSKAKRQVVILNCCFSGAFGDLVPMDEGAIDVGEVLEAEGRVVMTSTSSMDYAFERQNGELSVYGHYLIEGIRTGAAAAQGSDEITVGELHQYVSRKVQEASAMVPKIFAKGEAHRLQIAKVAIGDPEVKYRKKVEAILQEDGDEIDEMLSRPILAKLCAELQLEPQIAAKIEHEVLEPIRQRDAKRQQYLEFFQQVAQCYPFGEREQKRIAEYRRILGLGAEELEQLEAKILAGRIDSIPLESEKGVDYSELRDLLKAGEWEAADKETLKCILKGSGHLWLERDSMRNFPCKDLRTIDKLWVVASNGHFGFSVQAEIWLGYGSPLGDEKKQWDLFRWRMGCAKGTTRYSDLKKNPLHSERGELPFLGDYLNRTSFEEYCMGWCLLFRAKICGL